MALMEIHKHDGGVVELVSDAPDVHIFSQSYVDQAVKDGWIEFMGDPHVYDVYPDPNGEMKNASTLTLTSPGDKLVLHVVKDGKPKSIVYKITHYPVPRFFRMDFPGEAEDVRIAPEYGLELEA
jgi:hypothetical protein